MKKVCIGLIFLSLHVLLFSCWKEVLVKEYRDILLVYGLPEGQLSEDDFTGKNADSLVYLTFAGFTRGKIVREESRFSDQKHWVCVGDSVDQIAKIPVPPQEVKEVRKHNIDYTRYRYFVRDKRVDVYIKENKVEFMISLDFFK